MNASERRDLGKIIDAEINNLQIELQEREHQLSRVIRERIFRETAEDMQTILGQANAVLSVATTLGVTVIAMEENRSYRHGIVGGYKVEPANLDARIAQELDKLRGERKSGHLNLDHFRNELKKELLLGGIQSKDARAFLEKIPQVGALLPAVAEIEAK